VTPREWFETYGSKPELREPPKRRHFATIILVAETCPFQPCEASSYQQQKTQDSKGFRLKPFGPVCVATQGSLRCHANWPLRSRSCAAATPASRGAYRRAPWESPALYCALRSLGGHVSDTPVLHRKMSPLRRCLRFRLRAIGLEPFAQRHFWLRFWDISTVPFQWSSILLLPLVRGRLGGVLQKIQWVMSVWEWIYSFSSQRRRQGWGVV